MYEDIDIFDSVRKQFDLTGLKAIITGGAGFLGIQFAEAIAEMGGKPILIDINEKQLVEAGEKLKNSGYNNFSTYAIDITDEKKCKEIYELIWQENHGIDILINSAALTKVGIEDSNSDFFAPFEDIDQNLWEAGLKANLTGTQLACKIVGKKKDLMWAHLDAIGDHALPSVMRKVVKHVIRTGY